MRIPLTALAILTLAACAGTTRNPAMNAASELPADNPFAEASALPYGVPELDRIRNEHFRPALLAGMASQRAEVDAIANDRSAPTFDNTIVALERSGRLLTRVRAVFASLTASNTNPELEAVQTEMSPKFAAHSDATYLNAALFARVKTLYEGRSSLQLDAESKRLLERYHTAFVRAGARLSEADKQTLRGLNERLSALSNEFRQTVLKGVNAAAVIVDSEAELAGLSAEQIATAAAAAKTRNLEGKWVIALINTTGQPPLAQLKNRALRERIYKASFNRGFGGEFDTRGIAAEMAKLRAQRAALLGYPHHAAYVLEDETALTATAVNQMLGQLAPPAVANARREAAAMQAIIDAEAKAGAVSFQLQPWDWDYYAEQVRKAQYAFDEASVRPYFEMGRVLEDGVLFAAEELYGLRFKQRSDIPTYQADMRVYEVFDRDGSALGLVYFDWYARDNKRGGAWMSSYVEQSRLLGERPVVLNNLNIPKPPPGQPTLLTFDEVNTAFHEFGHALHGLFSNVTYPRFSGTSVPRDFVEFPSQYNEMWAVEPRVLANYAKHHQTGAPMPKELMDKVLAARKFNQGFATTEYLGAAVIDQAWHQLPPGSTPSADRIEAFEREALRAGSLDFATVPPRYRSTYFSHVFSGGYSAGYYAYIWSDVLARATEHWFHTHGGLTRANGDLLRAKVLSRGFSVDALTMFRDFYGKDPDIEPLLKARGLTAN